MKFRKYSLFKSLKRDDYVFYPIVIEINRLRQELELKELCDGICSPKQYSAFISNELGMSSEIAFSLMDRLGILFLTDEIFIEEGVMMINALIEENMFNEFDQAMWRYNEIEQDKMKYLSSPLAIEFLLIKMAYTSLNKRASFERCKNLLASIMPLLNREQKFLYYMYLGVDYYKMQHDFVGAKKYLDLARLEGGHPHIYTWIGVLELEKGNVIRAFNMFEKARRRYVNDGNITGLIFSTELIALAYYRQNDYISGIDVFNGALGYARSLNRTQLVNNFNNQLAWGYFRLGNFEKAKKILVFDTYNNDFTVNSSVTKFLIAYHMGDAVLVNDLIKEFSNRNKTLHRMICSIISKDGTDFLNRNEILSDDELLALSELSEITHFELKKEFDEILLKRYIENNNMDGIKRILSHNNFVNFRM